MTWIFLMALWTGGFLWLRVPRREVWMSCQCGRACRRELFVCRADQCEAKKVKI